MPLTYLLFQLRAPLSSWGEAAVGDFRPSSERPTQSGLIGLVGAALGLLRGDEAAHAALRDGYDWATAELAGGSLLRDYQTVQVPPRSSLKGRPRATRRQELALPSRELSTIVSTRDHRQGAHHLALVYAQPGARWPLPAVAQALREPRFTLYLGRKSCPPGAPLWPQCLEAETPWAALQAYHQQLAVLAPPLPRMQSVAFDVGLEFGLPPQLTRRRKDRLIRREGWQFGDRDEHFIQLAAGA
jgi:CRISPR system Cascade subunit CasD